MYQNSLHSNTDPIVSVQKRALVYQT